MTAEKLVYYYIVYLFFSHLMNQHILALEIPKTLNTRAFRIKDVSIYSDDLDISGGTIYIKAPGFKHPSQIEILPYFDIVLNACTMGIPGADCSEEPPAIQDGVYTIGYAVDPVEEVYVEYYHLRTSCTMNKLYKAWCDLEVSGCEPIEEVKLKLKELEFINSLIRTAEIKVEYCGEAEKGMEIFLYAKKRLERYFKSSCKSCS